MPHKYKIAIDTMTMATEFVTITTKLPGKIVVVDNKGMCVNARSILGVIYAMEFEELWCESERDIYNAIEKFIID